MSSLPKVDFGNVLRGSYDPSAQAIKFIDTTQLVPTKYDEIELGYTGSSLTSVVYKQEGTTVATLTLTYTGSNLTSVVRS